MRFNNKMKKGELFEAELAKRLVARGQVVYRRPKTLFHSQDMFGGDVLWLLDGEIVVIQCKKGKDLAIVKSRGRAAIRKNMKSIGYVKRYVTVCCGSKRNLYVIQFSRESELEGLTLGKILMAGGELECLFELVS